MHPRDNRSTRRATTYILELLEQGVLDRDTTIVNLLNFMSEDEVQQFAEIYGLTPDHKD